MRARRTLIRHLAGLTMPILLLASACATVPITGRKQLMLVSDYELAQASANSYAQLMAAAHQQGVYPLSPSESPEAAALLNGVGVVADRVIEAAGLRGWRDWSITVLKSRHVNAGVFPHGAIVIHGGLLQFAENDAQLAAVLGHEVAHVVARHAAERWSQLVAAQAALTAADIALADSRNQQLISVALGYGAQYGVLYPYSRAREHEADHIGLLYMAKAGYDPAQAIAFWGRHSEMHPGPWEFINTHPASANRSDRLRGLLPDAMLYFADRSRPLPKNLKELREALWAQDEAQSESPVGIRPPREQPGRWTRIKRSDRVTADTWTFRGYEACGASECAVSSSTAGETVRGIPDEAMVEVSFGDGRWVRYDPPLRILRWPLRVGDQWSGESLIETSEGLRNEVSWKVDVVSYESKVVRAGTFMAFHMILSINGMRFQEFWWAPETRQAILAVNPDEHGNMISAELVDFEPRRGPVQPLSAEP